MILEVCTGSIPSIIAAKEGGAQRVEVCAALEVGGLTPSLGHLRAAAEISGISKHVLIRPRGGDFCYTDHEISIMLHDIKLCADMGFDGVVIGALTADGQIDSAACRAFREAAGGMKFTFHRAFDECCDPHQALEDIISLGFDRILTSGQASKAHEALPLLRDLVTQAAGRIIIMPGSGVTPQNARHILQSTGASEIHASAKGDISHNTTLFPGVFDTSSEQVKMISAEITSIF